MAISNAAILTSLTKYTDQLAIGIIRESVIGARTNQYISVQEGIKYADTLNIINSTIVLQDGAACNNGIFSSTGSVTFTQNTLTVCPLKVEEVLCMTNIEQYFLGKRLPAGSYYDKLGPDDFAKIYVADKMSKIQQVIERVEWAGTNGSTGVTYSTQTTGPSSANNIQKCAGFLSVIDSNSTSVISIGATGATATNNYVYNAPTAGLTYSGAPTVTNIIGLIDLMFNNLSTDVLDRTDLTLFLSYANYLTLLTAMREAKYFDPSSFISAQSGYTCQFMSKPITILAVDGLKGSNRMVLTPASNLWFGTDLKSDWENFKVFYSDTLDAVVFRARWKQGVQIAYPQYVVTYLG